ncbi:MAG: hypothetical protein ACOC7P_01120 [Chloroflexota bacterium]
MANSGILIPDPFASSQQFDRFHHLDLPGLDDSELIDELHALRPLLWGLPKDDWLRRRVMMLESEMKRRKGVRNVIY